MPDWPYRNQVVTTHLHISNAPVELCRWRKDADTTIGISDKPDFLYVSSEREIFADAVIIFTSPYPNAAAAFCRHAEQLPELLSLLGPSWLIFGEQLTGVRAGFPRSTTRPTSRPKRPRSHRRRPHLPAGIFPLFTDARATLPGRCEQVEEPQFCLSFRPTSHQSLRVVRRFVIASREAA